MDIRYLKRENESGQEERFYPITHKDAIVGLDEIGGGGDSNAVPITRTVNGKELSENIVLNAEDIGAVPSEKVYGGLYSAFPSTVNAQNTMAEIYDACPIGITILPPIWGCSAYSPDGTNTKWEIVVFKHISGDANTEYMNAIGMYDGKFSVYNRYTNKWTGFLPLTGGTLIGSSLGLNNGFTSIGSNSYQASMNIKNEANNDTTTRGIELYNKASVDSISDALKLRDTVNGSSSWYKLYGEHNYPIKHTTTKEYVGTSNNLATCGTVTYGVLHNLNRMTTVHTADTNYTTYMARGVALVTSAPSSITNGCCAFVYA